MGHRNPGQPFAGGSAPLPNSQFTAKTLAPNRFQHQKRKSVFHAHCSHWGDFGKTAGRTQGLFVESRTHVLVRIRTSPTTACADLLTSPQTKNRSKKNHPTTPLRGANRGTPPENLIHLAYRHHKPIFGFRVSTTIEKNWTTH